MSNGVFFIFLVVVSAFAFFIIIESARLTWRMFISRRMTNSIKKFERHNPAAAQRILFIGDSTGHGTGTSHERYSVVGRLGADFPDAHIENHSKTGLALSQACQILRAKAAAKQPEQTAQPTLESNLSSAALELGVPSCSAKSAAPTVNAAANDS